MAEKKCELCGTPLTVESVGSICPACKQDYARLRANVQAVPLQTTPHAPAMRKKPANPLAIGLLAFAGLILASIVFSFAFSSWDTSSEAERNLIERVSVSGSEPKYSESEPTHNKLGPGASMAEYERIQTGMSYHQVCDVIGSAGTELSSNEIAGTRTVMYMWEGEGGAGSNMNAVFQNDELVQKAQFGLR